MRLAAKAAWPAALLLALAAACAPDRPKPAPAPEAAPQNPPDVRAAIPRPTPVRRETKFAPPQQSEEEEARESNRPNEPELLHADPGLSADGRPFPARHIYDPKFPEARRLRYVSADPGEAGDGTAARPWRNLQDALCRLEPGDRLVVLSGIYRGPFAVSGACRDGTDDAPIQVWAHHSFLRPEGDAPVLTVERSHWQFWEVQIALTDSKAPGLVLSGPGAHDVAVDQTHIYEGEGPAVIVGRGSRAITISNCHIHQSAGVRIEEGASEITLVSNHIHHNSSDSLRIGGSAVRVVGNRFHNDRGSGVVLSGCRDVTLSDNRLSNYRPREDRAEGGRAVSISGCRDVRLEGNAVLEATVGLEVAGGERIDAFRNFFENRLTAEAVALSVTSGRSVRFANAVVSGYPRDVLIRGRPPATESILVANSLFLDPAGPAVEVESPGVVRFARDVFSAAALPLKARAGQREVDLETLFDPAGGSRVVGGVSLEGRDLAAVRGFSPVDGGIALPGLDYRGAAPDIGVAER